jgi:hypothetical protein
MSRSPRPRIAISRFSKYFAGNKSAPGKALDFEVGCGIDDGTIFAVKVGIMALRSRTRFPCGAERGSRERRDDDPLFFGGARSKTLRVPLPT